MTFGIDEIYEKAEAQVPEQEKPWFDEGMDRGRKAYEDNAIFAPDLSHFVTKAQKQAYVKGYTTAVRMAVALDLAALSYLEAKWDYDEEINQNQEEEK